MLNAGQEAKSQILSIPVSDIPTTHADILHCKFETNLFIFDDFGIFVIDNNTSSAVEKSRPRFVSDNSASLIIP